MKGTNLQKKFRRDVLFSFLNVSKVTVLSGSAGVSCVHDSQMGHVIIHHCSNGGRNFWCWPSLGRGHISVVFDSCVGQHALCFQVLPFTRKQNERSECPSCSNRAL